MVGSRVPGRPHGVTFYSAVASFSTLVAEGGVALDNVALASSGTRVAVSGIFGNTGVAGAWGADKAVDGSMPTEWATQGDGDAAFLPTPITGRALRFEAIATTGGNAGTKQIERLVDR